MGHAVQTETRTKARVVRSLCVGSGLCTQLAPKVFAFDDNGKARAGSVPEADVQRARDAALACPARAIVLLALGRNGGRPAK